MITQDKKHNSACHFGSLSRKLDLSVALQRFGVVEELQIEKKTLTLALPSAHYCHGECQFAGA